MNAYRIIDANINRVSEGIRVLEDISRFILENTETTEQLRELRHNVRKSFLDERLIVERDSIHDIGYEISSNNKLDQKNSIEEVIMANFKRIQEGLRSIEEALKVLGNYSISKKFESMRYKSYQIEKDFLIKKQMFDTDIYGITGEMFSCGRDTISVVKEMIDAHIKVIQYREKNKSKKDKYNDCKAIRQLTREQKVVFIVNDDVDIAIAVDADGVHIGQDDMPISQVRKIVGSKIIGCSTHNRQQALVAVINGADYIGVGPVFETQTKQNVEKSEGLDYLKWVSENIKIPHVAIGGINSSNIEQVYNNGGKCVAMISEIVGAKDIKGKVKEIRALLRGKQ